MEYSPLGLRAGRQAPGSRGGSSAAGVPGRPGRRHPLVHREGLHLHLFRWPVHHLPCGPARLLRGQEGHRQGRGVERGAGRGSRRRGARGLAAGRGDGSIREAHRPGGDVRRRRHRRIDLATPPARNASPDAVASDHASSGVRRLRLRRAAWRAGSGDTPRPSDHRRGRTCVASRGPCSRLPEDQPG